MTPNRAVVASVSSLNLSELERALRDALSRPLPGVAGQAHMAPRPRTGWRPGHVPEGCRQGGALLLFYPRDLEAYFVLTLRSGGMLHHAAQVSLPGGAVEPGETIEQAALREAHEEVGLEAHAVRILGPLSPLHVPVSRYVLHPRVGVTDERPDFRPLAAEVETILEVSLRDLLDPDHVRRETRRMPESIEIPYFDLGGQKVWGATAMVLSELLVLIGRTPDPWG